MGVDSDRSSQSGDHLRILEFRVLFMAFCRMDCLFRFRGQLTAGSSIRVNRLSLLGIWLRLGRRRRLRLPLGRDQACCDHNEEQNSCEPAMAEALHDAPPAAEATPAGFRMVRMISP